MPNVTNFNREYRSGSTGCETGLEAQVYLGQFVLPTGAISKVFGIERSALRERGVELSSLLQVVSIGCDYALFFIADGNFPRGSTV
ncbi:hypothetical protein Metme_4391 [Methylomonas methanica MC09]|uniref:Uncharacterized protein n=1 Tax=Methylomonas methanica (strain DSM 25384 / MC09) TaxID=857087 RepID=G0A3W6_METMM|nr:hypothetical protein Metme_4391 [Methylomonas methanica MC09]